MLLKERWGIALPTLPEALADVIDVADLSEGRTFVNLNHFPLVYPLMTPPFREIRGREPISLHPEDAAVRGLFAGDIVRVFNDRGQLKLAAHVDDCVQRGVVTVTNGRWISLDGTAGADVVREGPVVTDDGPGASAESPLWNIRRIGAEQELFLVDDGSRSEEVNAAIRGARDISVPLSFSILTNIVAFIPLALGATSVPAGR